MKPISTWLGNFVSIAGAIMLGYSIHYWNHWWDPVFMVTCLAASVAGGVYAERRITKLTNEAIKFRGDAIESATTTMATAFLALHNMYSAARKGEQPPTA